MTRMLRVVLLLLMCASLNVVALAQNKDAQDKYSKGLQELEWKEWIGGAGRHGQVDRLIKPPNAVKAEKYFREAAALAPDWPLPWYSLGDMNFVLKKYSAAADAYSKANDTDKQSHKLDKETRRDMLDQLGISLAMSKKLEEAKNIYLAALKDDPNYPLFEYNLSCVYAEQGNLEEALSYLKKAWSHKEDMPEGQSFPDPRKDESFKKFWDDPEFQDAVREIVV